ncbi:hypothetical protein ACFQ0B_79755 [Nonomuraea thailandensis]
MAGGEPDSAELVLWTRLAPVPLAADGHGGMPPCRRASTGRSPPTPFRRTVRHGNADTGPEVAVVHVEVSGLQHHDRGQQALPQPSGDPPRPEPESRNSI